jgi:hypothetical protein
MNVREHYHSMKMDITSESQGSQGEILLLAKFRTNNNIIIEKIPAIPATIGAFLN